MHRPALLLLLLLASAPPPAPAMPPADSWQDLPVPGGSERVRAPREFFHLVGEARLPPDPTEDAGLLAAPAWLARNRPELTALPGFDAAGASALLRSLQGPVHVVLGRWSERTGELAIDVLRLQRAPGAGAQVVQVLSSPFTPAHGARWAAARAYLAPDEALADPARPGRNPFAAFAGADPSDPVFHRAGLAAAEVAVGHAMSHYRAALGLLALTGVDARMSQSSGGNILRRTYTTTVTGTSRIDWLVALPAAAQPQALPAAICVVATPCLDAACRARRPCPDPSLVAVSRVSFDDWGAASLPSAPEEVYRWSSTQSSWTPFALVLAAGALPAIGGLEPQLAGGLDTAAFTTAGVALLAWALTHPDRGAPAPALAGASLPAVPATVTDGVATPPPAPSSQQAAMDAAIGARTIAPALGAGALAALRQAWAGALPSAAAAGRGNAAQTLPSWNRLLRACTDAGLSGADLARCAGLDASGY
jgi:hypothetical protein